MSHAEEPAFEAVGLGRRYRRGWALRNCSLRLPVGRVAALVGPNGAGKSTLLHLAVGLLAPTEGTIRVLGDEVRARAHPRVAFLSQDKPLYRRFTVADMLSAGAALNERWDAPYAARLVDDAGLPSRARVGTLSGGQRSRLALALALGRRPELLLLDEPLADLDPLARRDVMATLMAEVAETGMTVLLSSHVLTDITETCDHLVVLGGGRVQVAGGIDDLVGGHRVLIGPAHQLGTHVPAEVVVEARTTSRQATVLVDDPGLAPGPDWVKHDAQLEDLVLAHLRRGQLPDTEQVPA
ncbi:ABC transporter ATP-binding protein [Geodermatophilus sp. DF01-2]|uniref:ATP-binding cassette domain-containing protein n=1 Tax=Geodermatophilus sp. DF01-2 TaxID=2559610 RepID=UPI001073305F|nr:ABC transporter ATP-binding protein [Geodermatophilus sp. DF01_2]TFV54271.1 ABC transporter ATP-binding protein [Geodermatophilus sp. DF01_2]